MLSNSASKPPRLYCPQRQANYTHCPNCCRSSFIRCWARAGISISPSVTGSRVPLRQASTTSQPSEVTG
jgi:hypothetical protein